METGQLLLDRGLVEEHQLVQARAAGGDVMAQLIQMKHVDSMAAHQAIAD